MSCFINDENNEVIKKKWWRHEKRKEAAWKQEGPTGEIWDNLKAKIFKDSNELLIIREKIGIHEFNN